MAVPGVRRYRMAALSLSVASCITAMVSRSITVVPASCPSNRSFFRSRLGRSSRRIGCPIGPWRRNGITGHFGPISSGVPLSDDVARPVAQSHRCRVVARSTAGDAGGFLVRPPRISAGPLWRGLLQPDHPELHQTHVDGDRRPGIGGDPLRSLPNAAVEGDKDETIRLVPYGCTKFRISTVSGDSQGLGRKAGQVRLSEDGRGHRLCRLPISDLARFLLRVKSRGSPTPPQKHGIEDGPKPPPLRRRHRNSQRSRGLGRISHPSSREISARPETCAGAITI